MRRESLSGLSVAAAVIGLSAVSVYTTALGLEFMLPGSAAWTAALSMQVILVTAVFATLTAAHQRRYLRAGLLALTYGITAAFSISGAFVSHDQRFSYDARSREVKLTARAAVARYVSDSAGAAMALKGRIEAQQARLQSKRDLEERQGVLSGRGAGFGPRTASVVMLMTEVRSLGINVTAAADRLSAAEGRFRDIETTAGPETMLPIVEQVAGVVAELQQSELAESNLAVRERDLGHVIGGQDLATEIHWPTAPSVSDIDTSRSHLQVVMAYRDVLAGKPASLLAMLLAVMVDLLLVLIALSGMQTIRRTAMPQAAGPDPRWPDAAMGYAQFLARRSPARRRALWTGLNSKIQWEVQPPAVLTGYLSARERALVEYLARSGVLIQGLTVLSVAPSASETFRELLVAELQRPAALPRRRRTSGIGA